MQTAFEEYTKKDNTKVKYYDLIIPKGTSTTYWIASRGIYTDSGGCSFRVSGVSSGSVYAYYMANSGPASSNASHALFPIVTLNSGLIKTGTDGTFVVNLE